MNISTEVQEGKKNHKRTKIFLAVVDSQRKLHLVVCSGSVQANQILSYTALSIYTEVQTLSYSKLV